MFGFFKKLFKQKRFDEGAIVTQGRTIAEELAKIFPDSQIILRDKYYLALQPSRLEDFLFKAYAKPFDYHSNSDEFPDCDDYAKVAVARVMECAVSEYMKYLPVFGYISYSRVSGARHAANIAIRSDGGVVLFEPQTERWLDTDGEVADQHVIIDI